MKINLEIPWKDVKLELPKKSGTYLLRAESLDLERPFYHIGWYHLEIQEWELYPIVFIPAITHWCEL